MKPDLTYDVIVVGAGHAGCEAAAAAGTMGFKTCLVTIHLETIAQMSCNPAIGGLAKGQLVREIDALGGLMGRLADETGIQFRLLNRSRGGAVQAPRAQCDKARYRLAMKRRLELVPNLTLFQGIVSGLVIERGRIHGVRTLEGTHLAARAVVLTPGTFLDGMIHIGLSSYPAGRANEPSATHLAEVLRKSGLKMLRLKTGTPMRLDGNTILWDKFVPQPGDDDPVPFSFRTETRLENKVICYQGYTNARTQAVIRRNLHLSPLYTGRIEGIGPRYCPSIEDKVVKFPHHRRHQFFLEPEGLDTAEVYANGLSSSLPFSVQEKILASIPGLDRAKVLRPAYGIEYDSVSATELSHSLETKRIAGLFLAGQINGTSGYEEAAAQGLMAGINAARSLQGKPGLLLGRHEAYIGVLIDDLVTKGVDEPYRLFTSRAEHRLRLRMDNADERLMKYGRELGLISNLEWEAQLEKRKNLSRIIRKLKETRIRTAGGESLSQFDCLKKPENRLSDMLKCAGDRERVSAEEVRYIESEVKYEGYIRKQDKEIMKISKADSIRIPAGFDFGDVPGLTTEAVEKLRKAGPGTIGRARALAGITPAAVANLSLYIEAKTRKASRIPDVSRET